MELAQAVEAAPSSEAREAVVAALNGAFGDHLAETANPLATPMQVRHGDRRLDPEDPRVDAPSRTLLVQVHGICMHEGQWGTEEHDPGALVAEALGATRLAVRYNSGRHISQTGCDLDALLHRLVTAWPVPVERIVIVGHSMGGLVSRSALHQAAQAGHGWAGRDVSLVMLGSPHQGAPLERLGNGVDTLLEASRYALPFARIGQMRSAGVTDLRHGTVREEDWRGRNRFARAGDTRTPTPLSPGVEAFVIAATTGDGTGGLKDQALGDGLVPLQSALGQHPDPRFDLGLPGSHRRVLPGRHHFDLLHDPAATAQMVAWLGRDGEAQR